MNQAELLELINNGENSGVEFKRNDCRSAFTTQSPDLNVLRDYGYVDARGMGVRTKIIPMVRAQSGQDPTFIATEDFLTVVMPKNR